MRGGKEKKYIFIPVNQNGTMIMGYNNFTINGQKEIQYIDGTIDKFENIYSRISISSGSFSKCYLLDIGDGLGLRPYQLINKESIVYQYSVSGVNIRKKVHELLPLKSNITDLAQNMHTIFPG